MKTMKKIIALLIFTAIWFAGFGQVISDDSLTTYTNTYIVTNGSRAITGAQVNTILNDLIDSKLNKDSAAVQYATFADSSLLNLITGIIRNKGEYPVSFDSTFFLTDSTVNTRLGFGVGWERTNGKIFIYRLSDLRDTLNRDAAATPSAYDTWVRDTVNGEIYPVTITDQVGIGIADPSEMLDVNGNINLAATSSTVGQLKQAGTVILSSYTDNAAQPNLFIGKSSGNFTMGGNYNTAVGFQNLMSNTTGSDLAAFGSKALDANTTGAYCTAVGAQALSENTDGNNNTAVGTNALAGNTGADYNTAVGANALYSLNGVGSHYNTAFGNEALYSKTSGTNNTALGNQAGRENITGSGNVFIGYQAGYNETGANQLYIENSNSATPLIKGDFAADTVLINGDFGVSKTIKLPATSSTVGQIKQGGSTIIHTYTDNAGQPNMFVGMTSGNYTMTGNYNYAFGNNALVNNTTGTYNFAGGASAANANTEGSYNFAIGGNTLLYNNTGINNVAVGYGAQTGISLDNVSNSVSIGTEAALNNMGDGNIAIGTNAMSGGGSATGADNVCIGALVMYPKTSGSRNVGIGKEALRQVTGGAYNTAIGFQAGYSLATAEASLMLGYQAGYNETSSNRLYIENSNATAPTAQIYGEFDNNYVNVYNKLSVNYSSAGSSVPGYNFAVYGNDGAYIDSNLTVDADITWKLRHAHAYFTDKTEALNLTQNVYIKITNGTNNLFTVDETMRVTCAGDSLTVLYSGDYVLHFSIDATGAGTNDNYKFKAYKNGTAVAGGPTAKGTDVNAAWIWYFDDLVAGDDICVKVTNTVDNDDITLNDAVMYFRKEH